MQIQSIFRAKFHFILYFYQGSKLRPFISYKKLIISIDNRTVVPWYANFLHDDSRCAISTYSYFILAKSYQKHRVSILFVFFINLFKDGIGRHRSFFEVKKLIGHTLDSEFRIEIFLANFTFSFLIRKEEYVILLSLNNIIIDPLPQTVIMSILNWPWTLAQWNQGILRGICWLKAHPTFILIDIWSNIR